MPQHGAGAMLQSRKALEPGGLFLSNPKMAATLYNLLGKIEGTLLRQRKLRTV